MIYNLYVGCSDSTEEKGSAIFERTAGIASNGDEVLK